MNKQLICFTVFALTRYCTNVFYTATVIVVNYLLFAVTRYSGQSVWYRTHHSGLVFPSPIKSNLMSDLLMAF